MVWAALGAMVPFPYLFSCFLKPRGAPWGRLGAFGKRLGRSWERLGGVLGSWGRLGGVLRPKICSRSFRWRPRVAPKSVPAWPTSAQEPFSPRNHPTFSSGSFRGTVPQAMPASRIKNNALTNIGSYLWSEQRISHSAKKFPFAM